MSIPNTRVEHVILSSLGDGFSPDRIKRYLFEEPPSESSFQMAIKELQVALVESGIDLAIALRATEVVSDPTIVRKVLSEKLGIGRWIEFRSSLLRVLFELADRDETLTEWVMTCEEAANQKRQNYRRLFPPYDE